MNRDINIIIMGRPVPTWDEPKDTKEEILNRTQDGMRRIDDEDDVIYNLVKDKEYHVIHRGSIMITIIVEDRDRTYAADRSSTPSLISDNDSSDEDDPNPRTGPGGRPFYQ